MVTTRDVFNLWVRLARYCDAVQTRCLEQSSLQRALVYPIAGEMLSKASALAPSIGLAITEDILHAMPNTSDHFVEVAVRALEGPILTHAGSNPIDAFRLLTLVHQKAHRIIDDSRSELAAPSLRVVDRVYRSVSSSTRQIPRALNLQELRYPRLMVGVR